MTAEIRWIRDGTASQQYFRAAVVGWQNSSYAVSLQIQAYNALTLNPPANPDAAHPMRVLAARRQILSSMLEFKGKLDQCIGKFRQRGIDCSAINEVRRSSRARLDRAESWRNIRNLTFHYGDIIELPAQLISTYQEIEAISDAEVNEVWHAMLDVGQQIRLIALNHV